MVLEHLDTILAFAVTMLLLSLIITTLVQMVSGLLHLRGKNLLWGTEQLLGQLDPRLAANARALATRVLRHPALTHDAKRMATAVRSSELVLVLGQIARDEIRRPPAPPAVPGSAGAAEGALSADALAALQELFQDKVGPDSPALEAKAQELIGRLTADFPPERVRELRSAVAQTFGRTSEIVVRVDAWFETVMDRTSERFKTWSRRITVGFALLFGLVLQVDSLALYQRLSTDEALRGRLLAMADQVGDQAAALLDPATSKIPFATQAIGQVLRQPRFAGGASAARLDGTLPALRDRPAGESWLRPRLTGAADAEAFLDAYGERYPEVVKAHLDQLNDTMSGLRAKVEATTPGLLPDRPTLAAYLDPLALVGMLMTVAFLSLGAPFWFNALRSLSALKPVVAQKVAADEQRTA